MFGLGLVIVAIYYFAKPGLFRACLPLCGLGLGLEFIGLGLGLCAKNLTKI